MFRSQLLLGAIPLSLLALFNTTPQPLTWSWDYVWILLTLALPGTALPVILWFWLMNKSPLYKLNVYSFLTPVFGLYLGYTYFSESLSLTQWLGVFLVIAAIPLVNSSTKRNV